MFTQGMKEKYGNCWNIKQVLEKSKVQRDVFRSQGKITRNTFIAYWAKTKSVLDFGYVTLNSSKFAELVSVLFRQKICNILWYATVQTHYTLTQALYHYADDVWGIMFSLDYDLKPHK